MLARTPEEVDHLFVKAMNEGDVEAMLALYEPDQVFVSQPGQPVVRGAGESLREKLRAFTKLRPQLKIEMKHVVEAGDIALYCCQWTMQVTGPDGQEQTLSGRDANVARRQPDGTWRILIDNPFHEEYMLKESTAS